MSTSAAFLTTSVFSFCFMKGNPSEEFPVREVAFGETQAKLQEFGGFVGVFRGCFPVVGVWFGLLWLVFCLLIL